MNSWLQGLSFSDFIIALTVLVSTIGAYFNLNNKLDSVSSKIEELEETQVEIKTELKEAEINHKKELIEATHRSADKIEALETKQRVFDLFMARFEEKMNYVSDQLKHIASMLEKRNDK
jgi:cell fate (sporulation/competence/biofilm development) regulator YmcA (YheA/YmcA/DUF963 family)